MGFVKADQNNVIMGCFLGLAIFLCPSLALSIESGYSYGPAVLLLASLSLFIFRIGKPLTSMDRKLAILLFSYFIVQVLYNLGFALPSRSYDGISRFLLAIPVYFVLIFYSPKPLYFWVGLMVGTWSAFVFAVYQIFFLIPPMDRAGGFINPIQFGDISFLMASLLLCGFIWARHTFKSFYIDVLFLLSSAAGFLASLLSLSRGGWLAVPFVLFVFFKALHVKTGKILVSFALFGCITAVTIALLPHTNAFKQRLIETQNDVSSVLDFNSSQESVSFNTRLQMWNVGIEAFSARPLTGWGSIKAIKSEYPTQWAPLDAIDNFGHLHNEYIDTLAKKGFLGFVMLMLIYVIPLLMFSKLMRSGDQKVVAFSAAGIILIVCVMIFGLTQTFMAHISGITIFPFFLVIIAAYAQNAKVIYELEYNKHLAELK
ncbi:MAG: O-antigen ligase family protein [Gammaproteobacteria bacterium]|nr:MAG: O-antigen ligase family protein [Gammaproteobacteria bacterium]